MVVVDPLGIEVPHHRGSLAASYQYKGHCLDIDPLSEEAFDFAALQNCDDAFFPFMEYLFYALAKIGTGFHHFGSQNGEQPATVENIAPMHLRHEFHHFSDLRARVGLAFKRGDNIDHPKVLGAFQDGKTQLFFAFKMEIEAAFRYLGGLENESKGCVIESMLPKQFHRGT
jgi:hypothetical protein